MPQVSDDKRNLTLRYGKRSDFLQTFHYVKQEEFSSFPSRCFFGTAPQLSKVNKDYGKGTAEEWLTYQLTYVSEFCGAKEKLTRMQIEELSRVISRKYGWLNVAELMLFFQKLKEGEYGRFYGSVDPQSILIALSTRFLRERWYAHEEREQAIREMERESYANNAVSYADYLKLKEQGKLKNI